MSVMRHRREDHERGATALFIAMSMVLLMGFAALTIDIGLGLNERRQDQSAADVGALVALQFAQPEVGCTTDCDTEAATNGAIEAMVVANASLDNPGAADWSVAAARCGSPPAGFSFRQTLTECVAFTNNFKRAWVRIPTIASPTYFARLLGADSIAVSADAIADQGFSNPGPVWPFLLPGSAANSNYNCLKTGPNPSWGACEDLPGTGNFGSMDFFLFGNPDRNTTEKCNGDTNGRLLSNIARGIDHPLGLHPSGVGAGIIEENVCSNLGAEPDMAKGQPGVGSALEDGLLYGGSSYSLDGTPYPGRIEGGFHVRNSGGGNADAFIDNTQLWTYLKSGLDPKCTSVSNPDQMIACIEWAKNTTTEIFEADIINSPRFGFTPGVWELNFLTPGQNYYIKEFRPVYADTTYYGCTSAGGVGTCAISHTVGVTDSGPCPVTPEFLTCGTPGPGTKGLDALTAYILDASILPDAAKQPGPGSAAQRFYNLSE